MKYLIATFALIFLLSMPAFAIYCTQCGQSLPDNAVFCSSCGQQLGEQTTPKSDELLFRVVILPDQRNASLATSMFRLTTDVTIEIDGQIATLSESVLENNKCFDINIGREFLGKQFKVAFNADRRKQRIGKLERWSNKKIECSSVLEEAGNNMAFYIVSAIIEDEVFFKKIEYRIYTAREALEIVKQDELAQKEAAQNAAKISEATDKYLERKAATQQQPVIQINQTPAKSSWSELSEQMNRQQQLQAIQDTNWELRKLNRKLGD